MSKLYKKYRQLKKENEELVYLFKVGNFYLLLDDDAKKANQLLGLKCTHLNDEVIKCGFPIDSLDKYLKLLESNQLQVKIIDKENIDNNEDYIRNQKINKILRKLEKQDINKINCIQALQYIKELKDLL